MVDDVRKFLMALGFEVPLDTMELLRIVCGRAMRKALALCGLREDEIESPGGLKQIAIDWAAGDYLAARRDTCQLEMKGIERAVQSIQEGDVQVRFLDSEKTDGQHLDELIGKLCEIREGELARYRKICW